MNLLYIFFLITPIYSNLILEPSSLYKLDLNKHFNSSVNIKLEIESNNIWSIHNNDNNHIYLSLILDNENDNYNWYIPFSLTKYWKNNTRLKITNILYPKYTDFLYFDIEGFTINHINDYFINQKLIASWETNSINNKSLYLINIKTKDKLFISNTNLNSLEWFIPKLNSGQHYILINNKYKSNAFNIKALTTTTSKTFTTTTDTPTSKTFTTTTDTTTSKTLTTLMNKSSIISDDIGRIPSYPKFEDKTKCNNMNCYKKIIILSALIILFIIIVIFYFYILKKVCCKPNKIDDCDHDVYPDNGRTINNPVYSN